MPGRVFGRRPPDLCPVRRVCAGAERAHGPKAPDAHPLPPKPKAGAALPGPPKAGGNPAPAFELCLPTAVPSRGPGGQRNGRGPPGPVAGGGGQGHQELCKCKGGRPRQLGAFAQGGAGQARHGPAHRPGPGAALLPAVCDPPGGKVFEQPHHYELPPGHLHCAGPSGKGDAHPPEPRPPGQPAQAGGQRPQLFPDGGGGENPQGPGGRAHQVAHGGAPAAGVRLPAGGAAGPQVGPRQLGERANPH